MNHWCRWLTLLLCLTVSACHTSNIAKSAEPTLLPSLNVVSGFQRGLNLAGDLEVSPRGAWGSPIKPQWFRKIADAGFDHVRIPIRWSAHTAAPPQYTIDSAFFDEVDALLDHALRAGLSVIINTHHFEALNDNPSHHRDELLAIWDQVSTRYQHRPLSLAFELNNEPTGVFDAHPHLWNTLVTETLAKVRLTNPDRWVFVGPVGYNHPEHLSELELPDDERLIATVHLYDPISFTLQGAPWMSPSPATGETWQPDQLTLNSPWHPASWDTTLTYLNHGVRVDFHRKHAAFAVQRHESTITNKTKMETTLVLQSNSRFSAVALCNIWDQVVDQPLTARQSQLGKMVVMTANLGDCSPIQSIGIQLDDESLVSPLISSIHLCETIEFTHDSCTPLLVSHRDYHYQILQHAEQWARHHQVPMYLGEFGVYDPVSHPVDQLSKYKWIQSVREAAEQHNIGWSFFEFANDFGVYNQVSDDWHSRVLEALLPKAEAR